MKKKTIDIGPQTDIGFVAKCVSQFIDQGVAMVNWQVKGGGLPRELLWRASKLGLWNHVSGSGLFDPDMPDRDWIANNPNIVHSFKNEGAESHHVSTAAPAELFSYNTLPRVPGRALWRDAQTPGQLLDLVAAHGKEKLLRLRKDRETGEIWETGTRLEYFFKRPEEIPPRLMETLVAMVDAGGSVDITHVRANLERAYLIGYAVEKGIIAGNSSLKHPRQVFIDRLKKMTGIDFSQCVERGYTSVRPEYRAMGIGAKLLEGLTARATDVRVFSIISEDNLATQKIAIRNNTRKITTYLSDKLGKEMGVWMPEHMVPADWIQGPGAGSMKEPGS
ncbi:MAG: hypothetical protein HUN04_23980 [Desulfobacter sp.]|nr:MAG: hypothetical protein HUN04_23980 [Desulfobacter sp.]